MPRLFNSGVSYFSYASSVGFGHVSSNRPAVRVFDAMDYGPGRCRWIVCSDQGPAENDQGCYTVPKYSIRVNAVVARYPVDYRLSLSAASLDEARNYPLIIPVELNMVNRETPGHSTLGIPGTNGKAEG